MSKIIEGIHIGEHKIRIVPEFDYVATIAPVATPVNTGIAISELTTHTMISVSMVVLVNGTKYIIYNNVVTALLASPSNYGIRVSRTTEFETGTGDVSFSYWVDGTTQTIWYDYDFDTATPVFDSISIIGYDFLV